MTRRRFAPVFCLLTQPPETPPSDDRLPNGKRRSEELIKADYKDNLRDLDEMKKQIEEVRTDIEKNEGHVLSLANLKKLEQVEKLSQRIRSRMKRF